MASRSVPVGFPAKLEGPMAWDGASYKSAPKKYIHHLSQDELHDIDKALRHFQSLNLAPGFVSPETFRLSPPFASLLANISKELHEGRGFGVLRGLDPRKYKPAENVIIFAGIASYVGGERATDTGGLTLSHIRNAMKDKLPVGFSPEKLVPSKRAEAMAFHTDTAAGDILAMYIKGLQSGSGGTQHLASFWQVYNVLAKEAPHVLQTLAKPFPWEEVDPDTKQPRCAQRPIIFYVGNKLQIQYVTVPLRGSLDHPRPKELTPLTAEQEEALDKLQSVAERLSFELDRVLGDIQFVNNFSIMHGRTAYCEELNEFAVQDATSSDIQKMQWVWAHMETKVESISVLKETCDKKKDDTTKCSSISTTSSPTAITIDNTKISTTSSKKTDITLTERHVITTTTDHKVTTINTVTKLPSDDTVTVKYKTNSPETEVALSETILTDSAVNGDHNKKLTVTTKTTTSYECPPPPTATTTTTTTSTTVPYPGVGPVKTSPELRPLHPRHFLRLFLRDKARAWTKPKVYHERIEACFAVPAEKQFMPEVDFDAADATAPSGTTTHG